MSRVVAYVAALLAVVACSLNARERASETPEPRYDAREHCIDQTLAAVIALSAGAGSTAETLEALQTVENLVEGRGPRFDWVVQNAGEVTRGRADSGREGAMRAMDALEERLRGQNASDTTAAELTGTTPSSQLCPADPASVSSSPSPAAPLTTAPQAPDRVSVALPDLALGCEEILTQLGPRLLANPNEVLQQMAATYGRAGDQVIDAAFNFSDDPRLDTDPKAVARDACI